MSDAPKVVVTANGPYLVSGELPLSIESMQPLPDGDSWEWRAERTLEAPPKYALCRCGESQTKPFCDGTHTRVSWDPAETASRATFDELAGVEAGPALTLADATSLCAFARFCDNYGRIWNLIQATGDERQRAIVEHEATHCPSGRLVVRDTATGAAIEPVYAPSIALVEDAGKAVSGPIWLRGGVALESQDGSAYETRNRVTLCRCGRSENKPYCDGTHVDVAFVDGLTE